MLTRDRLISLYQDARDTEILSLYVDAEQHDPAKRRLWTKRVEHAFSECRAKVEVSGGDLEAFDAARGHLQGELDSFSSFLPGPGWVGFAGAEGLVHAHLVPVPMPTLAAWERGLRVAPYVRALKQDRPVVVALADRRRTRIFTYLQGDLEATGDLQVSEGDDADEESGRRSGKRSGSRGNATDEAHQQAEVKAGRMLSQAVEQIQELVNGDGLVVVGGTRETGARLMSLLPDRLQERATVVQSLHLDMTPAQVKEQAEEAATEVTRRLQEGVADIVVDRAKSGGRGVLGDEGTVAALLERRVDTLVLSRNFVAEAGDRADHMVGTAFEQGASVEEISGAGAERLDADGGGVGALLRW